MRTKTRWLVSLLAVVALLASTTAALARGPWETADVFGQGPGGPMVAADGAAILRIGDGVNAKLSMPTPEPGSYNYPEGPTASAEEGHPEAFSLWVFIFFDPDQCAATPCTLADFLNPDVEAGAFNGGGHLVGGPHLTMAGRIIHRTPTFGPPAANPITIGEALARGYDLDDAEIHLAVAPHGALDPALLPEQIKTPAGGPDDWWIAMFFP